MTYTNSTWSLTAATTPAITCDDNDHSLNFPKQSKWNSSLKMSTLSSVLFLVINNTEIKKKLMQLQIMPRIRRCTERDKHWSWKLLLQLFFHWCGPSQFREINIGFAYNITVFSFSYRCPENQSLLQNKCVSTILMFHISTYCKQGGAVCLENRLASS